MTGKMSLRKKLVLVVISLMLPINLLSVFLSYRVLADTRMRLLAERRNTVRLFANQMEERFQIFETYVYKIISDEYRSGFLLESDGAEYGLTKSRLWNEFVEVETVLPEKNSIYVKIHSSGETFYCPSSLVSYQESHELAQEIASLKKAVDWEIYEGQNRERYLHFCVGNSIYNIGIVIWIDPLTKEWAAEESMGELAILSRHEIADREGFVTIAESFLTEDLFMVYHIPEKEIDLDVPFIMWWMLWVSFLSFVVLFVILLALKGIILRPLKKIDDAIKRIEGGEIEYRIENYDTTTELYNIERNFNRMMGQIYDLRIEKYDLQIENQKIQMENLQQQLNPHLLLNSLTTIYSLAQTKKLDLLQEFSIHLVGYLRYAFRNIDKMVTIRQEMEFIENYLFIQKVRWPGKFCVLYDVEEELEELLIPPLLIQNFVENSTKHGILEERMIEIDVIIKKREDFLTISICDNGAGIPSDVLEQIRSGQPVYDENGRHIGIWNCMKRLQLFYGDFAQMKITSEKNAGTQIWIEIRDGQRGAEGKEDESVTC